MGPLLTISAVASYDANDVAWNPISNTFVVVTHGSTAQDLALELSATGEVLDPAGVAFGVPTGNGNFNPRLASSTSGADWLGVTSTEFGRLTAERISTATRPQTPDAGTEADAGSIDPPDAGSGADAGTSDAGLSPRPPDAGVIADAGTNITGTGSCGCTTVSAPFFYVLLFGAAWLTRPRAARRR